MILIQPLVLANPMIRLFSDKLYADSGAFENLDLFICFQIVDFDSFVHNTSQVSECTRDIGSIRRRKRSTCLIGWESEHPL